MLQTIEKYTDSKGKNWAVVHTEVGPFFIDVISHYGDHIQFQVRPVNHCNTIRFFPDRYSFAVTKWNGKKFFWRGIIDVTSPAYGGNNLTLQSGWTEITGIDDEKVRQDATEAMEVILPDVVDFIKSNWDWLMEPLIQERRKKIEDEYQEMLKIHDTWVDATEELRGLL